MSGNEEPKPKQANPQISVLGTDDGDVILRIDIRIAPVNAVKLVKMLVIAAREMLKKKRIIVPGGGA